MASLHPWAHSAPSQATVDYSLRAVLGGSPLHSDPYSLLQVRQLRCIHFFHLNCIDQWLSLASTCPVCKLDFHDLRPEDLESEEGERPEAGVEGRHGERDSNREGEEEAPVGHLLAEEVHDEVVIEASARSGRGSPNGHSG